MLGILSRFQKWMVFIVLKAWNAGGENPESAEDAQNQAKCASSKFINLFVKICNSKVKLYNSVLSNNKTDNSPRFIATYLLLRMLFFVVKISLLFFMDNTLENGECAEAEVPIHSRYHSAIIF